MFCFNFNKFEILSIFSSIPFSFLNSPIQPILIIPSFTLFNFICSVFISECSKEIIFLLTLVETYVAIFLFILSPNTQKYIPFGGVNFSDFNFSNAFFETEFKGNGLYRYSNSP